MSQVITPNYLKSLRSNLHVECAKAPKLTYDSEQKDRYNDYFFQMLIFEKGQDIPKLVYGTKKDLQAKYGSDCEKQSLPFPTSGAKVDPSFLESVPNKSQLKSAQFSTVRFLLQCRLLSQLMTYTWIDDDKIPQGNKQEILLVRKILDTYNLVPETFWLDSQDNEYHVEDLEIESKLLETKKKDEGLLDFLLKPDHIGYGSISLALLLSGQAYYQNEDNQWKQIISSILSTYEIIWEYGIDLSWDTFYATRRDLSQAGETPKPPYTMVTFSYPPRPTQFNVTQKQIKEWATAPQYDGEDNDYPFYPIKDSSDWENQQLKFIAPPYPYIPLSCI